MRAFCKQRGVGDHSFYLWRKRLRKEENEPVEFALMKTVGSLAQMELALANGDRLSIPAGVDAATLRLAPPAGAPAPPVRGPRRRVRK